MTSTTSGSVIISTALAWAITGCDRAPSESTPPGGTSTAAQPRQRTQAPVGGEGPGAASPSDPEALDAPAVGYWQDEASGTSASPLGSTFAPQHGLWVREDGSYVYGTNPLDPAGWIVRFGTWEEIDDVLVLTEQLRVEGWGGQAGFESGSITAEGEAPRCAKVDPAVDVTRVQGRADCGLLDPFDEFSGMSCRTVDGVRLRRVGEAAAFMSQWDESYYRSACGTR